jgi:hypothetical protein
MRAIIVGFLCSLLAAAGDTGVPPRAHASDYPVHQSAKTAELAATILPVGQIERVFSAEIARQYVVVEVAVYPHDGQTFDIDWFDFALKSGATVSHVEKPRDVATPWPEKSGIPDKPVSLISETGVVYSRSSDPVNGRRSGWGTYEGVGVTNDPRAAAPPPAPKQGQDPQVVEQRVRERSLPQGQTRIPVAGYLFFPQYGKKHKNETTELQWSKDDASVVLHLK